MNTKFSIPNSPEFDNSNITEVQNFQIKFVEKMLEPVLGKKVNLVLHWKGEFLNVPYYKENDYKLPFGLAPHMSKNLKTEKQILSVIVHSTTIHAYAIPSAINILTNR